MPMSNVLPSTITAVRLYAHGGPDMLRVEEVHVPAPGSDEVLVRVRAAAVSGYSRHVRIDTQRAAGRSQVARRRSVWS